MGKTRGKGLALLIFSVFLLSLVSCARKTTELPKDLLGLYVGMKKEDAQKRLEQIAAFERDEEKNQQIWRLKNDSRFGELAIGYNKENQIQYITAFVDAATAKEKIRFSDVGDLSRAKKEIVEPHHRYIWEVPAKDERAAYYVNVYGDSSETVTIYTLNRVLKPGEAAEEEEEDE